MEKVLNGILFKLKHFRTQNPALETTFYLYHGLDSPRPTLLLVNPSDVIPHVIHPAEDAWTPFPPALDAGIMLGFMPAPVLPAGEAPGGGLGTSGVPTEEVSPVSLVVLAQVASAVEDGSRGAAGV